MRCRSNTILVFVFCLCWLASAQTSPPAVPRQTSAPVPGVMPARPSSAAQNPFFGGVPSGQASAGEIALSFQDAIERGLKHNLGVVLGQESTRLAQGAQWRARSALLPNLSGALSATSQQINLAALGFSGFPGIPLVIGPFSVYDARAYISQEVLNVSAIRNLQSQSRGTRAARFSYQDAREVVVLVVSNLYLQAVAGRARIDSSQAQFATAQALYQRAVDMKNAGVVAGIDVLRAQVEMQAQRQRVIYFQNEFEKQKLQLARAIGLPSGQRFSLSDQVPYTPPPPLTFEQASAQAYQSRPDYRGAQEQVAAAELARKAAVAEHYPSIGINANYGDIGQRIGTSHGSYTAGASLSFPIFQGGRIHADVEQADAVLQQRKAELEDLRSSIDYDIRTAFLDLKAAGDQVEVARSANDLAGQQLKQSQDRFSAGVTNSVEVVQSQEAVATANENYISSLYAYNLAKAALARAIGGGEKLSRLFLGVGGH